MDFVGGYGVVVNQETDMPAVMFNTGMIVCQTQAQCDLLMSPKNTQVVQAPDFRYNQMDAGDSLNDGGWQ